MGRLFCIMQTALRILLICFIVFFSSCATVHNDVELFYKGEDALQYFFPSRDWKSFEEGLGLEADWLYRTYTLAGEEGGPRTILNMSLYSEGSRYRSVPEEIRLSAGNVNIAIPSEQISLVYLDQGKVRYSSWLYSAAAEELMAEASGGVVMTLVLDKELSFASSEDFVHHVEYFQEVLLGIPQNDS